MPQSDHRVQPNRAWSARVVDDLSGVVTASARINGQVRARHQFTAPRRQAQLRVASPRGGWLPGQHRFEISARDQAGNSVTRRGAFTVPGTVRTVFQAFNSAGRPTIQVRSTSGECFSGSAATTRRDAWRCRVGNRIYDPCFSSGSARGVVICPTNLRLTGGIRIRLTQPLPRRFGNNRAPSLALQPWDIELANGWRCRILTGATDVFSGMRLNYGCSGGGRNGNAGLVRVCELRARDDPRQRLQCAVGV